MTIPHEVSQKQLNKVGVRIVKSESLTLRCMRCTQTWVVKQKGLRLPRGYWRCPNSCNAETRKRHP